MCARKQSCRIFANAAAAVDDGDGDGGAYGFCVL